MPFVSLALTDSADQAPPRGEYRFENPKVSEFCFVLKAGPKAADTWVLKASSLAQYQAWIKELVLCGATVHYDTAQRLAGLTHWLSKSAAAEADSSFQLAI